MTGKCITSTMTSHILRRHEITLSKTKAAADNCEKNKHISTGQLRLPEALGLRNKYPRSLTKHGDITRYIGVFIAKDIRPFSMLANSGFINMNRALDPTYDMPGESHFSETGIQKLYDETKKRVCEELKNAEYNIRKILYIQYEFFSKIAYMYMYI